MTLALAPGQGPVAVHRWFARGEDWAMHPWFTPHVGEVLRALDDRIKARQAGSFQLDAAGGVLVGELLEDRDCLDPRALERRPCVVRLAFVAGPLSFREQEGVLASLRGRPLPASPGIDQGMIVAVPQVAPSARAPARREATPRAGVPLSTLAILILLAVATAVAAVVWLFTRPLPPEDMPPPGTKEKGRPPRANLETLLHRYAKIEHPYVVFLKRTPEALKRGRRGGETSYEEWRAAQLPLFRHSEHPLPRRLRERVALWRELPPSLAEPAQRMRRIRLRWTGGEEMPTLADEFDAFFEAATRPGELPPREEFDHPANAFLWRLPRDPVAAGRTFDTEKQLREALSRLAERLTGAHPESSAESLDLLGITERATDYIAWREEQASKGVVFADADVEPGSAIVKGLRRFAGGH